MATKHIGTAALVAFLVTLTGGASYIAYRAFSLPGAMPTQFIGMMTAGIILSILVGAGLMALLFYSNRHGYDEPPDIR